MPAMHQEVKDHFKSTATDLLQRMLALKPLTITHEECLRIVAPPEHFAILREATQVAYVYSSDSWFSVQLPFEIDGVKSPTVQLCMRTHEGKEPPLMPRSPMFQHETAPVDAVKQLLEVAEHHLAQTRMAAVVNYLVDDLADRCKTGAEVRYLWPSVLYLANKGIWTRVDNWLDKYSQYKAVRNAPAVPPTIRTMIGMATQWLAQAHMLDEKLKKEEGEVQFNARSHAFKIGELALSRGSED